MMASVSSLLVTLATTALAALSPPSNLLSRTTSFQPAVIRALYEAPRATSYAATLAATLEHVGHASTRAIVLEHVGGGLYRSDPLLAVTRTGELPPALASLPIVRVGADRDVLVLSSTALPDAPGTKLTASLALKSQPRIELPSGTSSYVATDTLALGDEFRVTYRPDYRVSGDKLTVMVGIPTDSGELSGAVMLVLTASTKPGEEGLFVSSELVRVVLDGRPAMDNSQRVLYVPFVGAPFELRVVEEYPAGVVPVPILEELRRDAADPDEFATDSDARNLPEALTGNSPEAGMGVSVHNQEQVTALELMTVPGRGLDYTLAITHRSRIRFAGVLGERFVHNYDLRLRVYETYVGFYDGHGREIRFTKTSGGAYEPEPGGYLELTRAGSVGPFSIVTPDGTTMLFRTDAVRGFHLIEEIRDRHANTLTFRYAENGLLTVVRDPFGRPYRYHYDKLMRLAVVTDFTGRTVRFFYDESPSKTPLGAGAVSRSQRLLEIHALPVSSGLAEGVTENELVTRFGYDDLGRLVGMSRTSGVVRKTVYRGTGGRVASQELGQDGEYSKTVRIDFTPGSDTVTVETRGGATRHFRFTQKKVGSLSIPALRTVAHETVLQGGGGLADELTRVIYNEQLEAFETHDPRGGITRHHYTVGAPVLRRGNLTLEERIPAPFSQVSAEIGAMDMAAYAASENDYTSELRREMRAAVASAHAHAGTLRTRYVYEPRYNQVKKITYPDGTIVEHEFDETTGDRIKTIGVAGDGDATRPTWTYTRNPAGQLVRTEDELGRVKTYHYYKPVAATSGAFEGDPLYRDAGGEAPAADDTLALSTERGGYLARVVDEAFHTWVEYSRDARGNATTVIDERSVVAESVFNERDQLVRERRVGRERAAATLRGGTAVDLDTAAECGHADSG